MSRAIRGLSGLAAIAVLGLFLVTWMGEGPAPSSTSTPSSGPVDARSLPTPERTTSTQFREDATGLVDAATKDGGAPGVAKLRLRVISRKLRRPVPGAVIQLMKGARWSRDAETYATRSSDRSGRIDFEVGEVGTYRIYWIEQVEPRSTSLCGNLEVKAVPSEMAQDIHIDDDARTFHREDLTAFVVSIVDRSGRPFDEAAMDRWFEPDRWGRYSRGRSGARVVGPEGPLAVRQNRRVGNHLELLSRNGSWEGVVELWSFGVRIASRPSRSDEEMIEFELDPAGPDGMLTGGGSLEIRVRSGPGGPLIRNAMVRVQPLGLPTGRPRRNLDTGNPGAPVETGVIGAGDYRVLVTDAEHGPWTTTLAVEEGRRHELDVPLLPPADAVLRFLLPEGMPASESGAKPTVYFAEGTPVPADLRRIDPEVEEELSFEAFGMPASDCLVLFERNVFRLGVSPGENGERTFRVHPGRWIRVIAPITLPAGEVPVNCNLRVALQTRGGLCVDDATHHAMGGNDGKVDLYTWAPPGVWRVELSGTVNDLRIDRSQEVVVTAEREVTEALLAAGGG